ncbi:MAG: NnrS family protein [Comamonadaceae bacterium]|nr:NnrS family protein [Comamonadaceae bacterium]
MDRHRLKPAPFVASSATPPAPPATPDAAAGGGQAPGPAAPQAWRVWRLAHPVWLCAFRPFFAFAALSAVGLMAAWAAFLWLGWPLPGVPGGPFAWHAHELLLGFGLAAVAGFALTAVPEFTETPAFPAAAVRWLALLWLLGRAAFWASGAWPRPALALAAACHLALLGGLLALLAPRLWRDPQRRHLSFLWAIVLLALTAAGFYADAWRGQPATRWLHAMLGVLMALIVVAMSRISMRVVNASIEEHEARLSSSADDASEAARYLARPPRRHLAVICITLFTAAQWLQPGGHVSAWLALASACAMLNLMGDWHVGRALWRRWPLMLYTVYACMAAGYALTGAALLGGAIHANAGLHLLTTGALGLGIYGVICIAGYTHSGLDKDGRAWAPLGAALLAASAVLRAAAYAHAPHLLMPAAALLWCAAFALMGAYMLPVFLRPRTDGGAGCDGVLPPPTQNGA